MEPIKELQDELASFKESFDHVVRERDELAAKVRRLSSTVHDLRTEIVRLRRVHYDSFDMAKSANDLLSSIASLQGVTQ